MQNWPRLPFRACSSLRRSSDHVEEVPVNFACCLFINMQSVYVKNSVALLSAMEFIYGSTFVPYGPVGQILFVISAPSN